jgi:hypothetical protein
VLECKPTDERGEWDGRRVLRVEVDPDRSPSVGDGIVLSVPGRRFSVPGGDTSADQKLCQVGIVTRICRDREINLDARLMGESFESRPTRCGVSTASETSSRTRRSSSAADDENSNRYCARMCAQ